MNGVYKYVYGNEIIYIGKSDNSIIDRISAHTKEEKFAPYIDKADIYYSPCINSAHTKVVETCLINKYKPILNTIDKYEESFDVGFIEPTWYKISKSYSQSMNMNILLLKGESACDDLIHEKAESAYKLLFSDSLNEYNKKQARPSRQIENYYTHIKNGKREAPFYEFRIELKNIKKVSGMLFDNMVDSFKKRNPNFYVFDAGISDDYENIYIYINFIPFYTTGRTKGLSKGVSMKAALLEQGFHFTSRGVSGTTLWQVRELRENEEVLLQTYAVNAVEKHLFINKIVCLFKKRFLKRCNLIKV